MLVTGHSTHPTGRAIITHFTMAGVTDCHANVYFPADGHLDILQEVLDWVYPYLLLTPARVVFRDRRSEFQLLLGPPSSGIPRAAL